MHVSPESVIRFDMVVSSLNPVLLVYQDGSIVRRNGRAVRVRIDSSGYMQVTATDSRGLRYYLWHRVVALAYVPGYFPGAEVNHINGIKTDNRPENLEWVTRGQNQAHAVATGLHPRGELAGGCRFSDVDVAAMRSARASGESVSSIARRYRADRKHIGQIVNCRTRAL